MTEADGQTHALQIIAKAVKIVATQVSYDGVATALLNAALNLSGAARGAVILAAKGDLKLNDSGFEPGLPLVAKLKPDAEIADLPLDVLKTVLDSRAPIVRGVRTGAAVLCAPVASEDTFKGLLYLEFNAARRATSENAAAVMLLASQAAMTLEALADHGSQGENSIRPTVSPPPGSVASFRWNPATRLSIGSPEYYRMLGFDPHDGPIDFVSIAGRVHPADYPTAQAVVDDVVRRRAPFRMEFRLVLPSGDIRNLMWSGHFDLADPDSPELVGVVMDVSELRAADDLLRAAHEDADRQLRLAWLGEMAGSIIHEVNQPLGSIISSVDAALRWLERDEPDIEAATKSVERIGEIARGAGRTVADMRAMTSSSPEVVERSMNSIVGEALQMSSAMMFRLDVRTDIVFDPDRPMVSVNPAQFLQVILNLVHNAIDSMREVSNRPRTLHVRTGIDAGTVIVEIGDTGIGLPNGDTSRLFNPLYTTKKGGMGLGLSICRRVVLAHGGTIAARSNPEFGATFTISLPRSL